MKDFVIDEAEVSVAVNKILRETEILYNSINEYIKVLEGIKSSGAIQDNLINAEIMELAMKVQNIQNGVREIGSNQIDYILRQAVYEIEEQDNFRFPDDIISIVSGILGIFI